MKKVYIGQAPSLSVSTKKVFDSPINNQKWQANKDDLLWRRLALVAGCLRSRRKPQAEIAL